MSTTKLSPTNDISEKTIDWVDILLHDCEPNERLELLVKSAATLFKVPIAMVNLLAPEMVVFMACTGQNHGDYLERDGSFCDVAVSQEQPLNIVDATKDKRFKDFSIVTNEMQIKSYLGKALHAPDGARIGTLCLLDIKPRKYTKLNQRVLSDLAASVELELRNILRLKMQIS